MDFARSGYTLVEVVVAVVVFAVGALALTGGSALVVRTMAANAVRDEATRLATSRLEQIRAQCAGATSGAEIVRGVRSEWSVEASSSTVSVVEVVTFASRSGPRTETFRSSFACQ